MPQRADIVLEMNGKRWPFYLANGVKSIDESWFEPSSFGIQFSRGKKRYGDDPLISLCEWRDWTGGRGGKNSADDETRFFDGNAWSMSEGKVFSNPQWKYAFGNRVQCIHFPGVTNQAAAADTATFWKPLFGTTRGVSSMLNPAAGFDALRIELIIRRVGTPGDIAVDLCLSKDATSHLVGAPYTVLQSGTLTTATITDWTSVTQEFNINSQALELGHIYHVKVYGATTDNDANHWEVLCGYKGAGYSDVEKSYYSANLTDWTVSSIHRMYYRVTDADIPGRFLFQTCWTDYFTATSIPDTGTSVFSLWNETTDVFGPATSGLTKITGRPMYSGSYMYFPQGDSVPIRRLQDDGATWSDDGTNVANILCKYYDGVDGPQVVRARNSTYSRTISRSNSAALGYGLTFGTDTYVGDNSYNITNMTVHDGQLYVIKEDSLWAFDRDTLTYKDSNLKNTPSSRNGNVFLSWNNLLYFSWLNTIMQAYGGTAGDIGQAWRGEGPNDNRAAAYPSCAIGVSGWMFVGFDAGSSGTSYVHVYNGLTWHEIFRAPRGKRVRDIWWQHVDGTRSRLWVDIGTDIVYIEFPTDVAGPLNDSTLKYHYDWSIETTTFDDGTAKLPKYFKDITISSVNLDGHTTFMDIDYQYDDMIGKSGAANWLRLGTVSVSPEQTIPMNLGNKRAIRFRIRGYSNTTTTPPILLAITVEGFTRAPSRRMWNVRVRTERNGIGRRNSSNLLAFLNEASEFPGKVMMRSKIPEMNNRFVIVRHPRVNRTLMNAIRKWWSGEMTLSLLDVT
jgi:hypothetical protein